MLQYFKLEHVKHVNGAEHRGTACYYAVRYSFMRACLIFQIELRLQLPYWALLIASAVSWGWEYRNVLIPKQSICLLVDGWALNLFDLGDCQCFHSINCLLHFSSKWDIYISSSVIILFRNMISSFLDLQIFQSIIFMFDVCSSDSCLDAVVNWKIFCPSLGSNHTSSAIQHIA